VEQAPLEVYTVDAARPIMGCVEGLHREFDDRALVTVMGQGFYGPDHLALELHSPLATKWTALSHLLGLWGIPAERVVAIGDDVNDIPMLRSAGLSFAMGNAKDEVKAAADRVTASNDEDGVVKALRGVFADLG